MVEPAGLAGFFIEDLQPNSIAAAELLAQQTRPPQSANSGP